LVRLPTPAVSIAIRAYRRRWLGAAVSSVLAQTHHDLELVIYDDAGDLEDVANAARDGRVRYHRAERRLQASGRFLAAVGVCRAPYVGLLDDDDRYEPAFVARLLEALEKDPEAGVAFCRTTWEADGRRIRPRDSRPPGRQPNLPTAMLADGWTVAPSQMLVRRTALEAAARVQPMPDGVAPDVFVNVRIALAGWHHVLVDAPLVVCRWHADQSSRRFPSANDVAVATWRSIELGEAALSRLRDRRLARAHLVRAFDRLRAGDTRGAREDVRAAAGACHSAWRGPRRLLRAAAAVGPAGRMAATAWLAWSPQGRRRAEPPLVIGDR
jgi:glycosyltransferase involved in cell wall biosynthesis